MNLRVVIAACFCLHGIAHGLTRREVFSNSAVHLSITCGDSTGSGFIFFRPDPSNGKVGKVFLVTNKHVLPAEGKECGITMRASIMTNGAMTIKAVNIPIMGADGKYRRDFVRLHKENDVAALNITPEIRANGIVADFVPTGLLGTKERLKTGNVALPGNDIYLVGYPAGLYDKRNAFPIWRVGIISTSPLLGYAFPDEFQKAFKLPSFIDGFLVDAHVYPGSSGSAVIIKPQAISFDNPSGVSAGGAGAITYVLGLVSRSVPYGDFGGKIPTRIGIGVVESADAVNDTIEAFFTR